MKRACAVLMLAVLAVGPALPCALSCVRAAEHAVAAESCHSTAASEPSVESGLACADHRLPVALIAKRSDARPDGFITALAGVSPGPSVAFAPTSFGGREAPAAGPPHTRLRVLLRI